MARSLAGHGSATTPGKARAAVMEATKDEPLGDVFNDVCDSHQDYIWHVAIQAPWLLAVCWNHGGPRMRGPSSLPSLTGRVTVRPTSSGSRTFPA